MKRYFISTRPQAKRCVLVRIVDGKKIWNFSKTGAFYPTGDTIFWIEHYLLPQRKMREVSFEEACHFAACHTKRNPILSEALDWLK